MKTLSLFLLLTLLPSRPAQDVQEKKKTEQQQEKEPELFIPTEKLPADGAISFPVDI